MTVKSADKKPEKYVGPDGKTKIRMVSVDKEVVKSEAANEAKDPARTVSQLAIRDTNRRFDRAKKAAKKDDENSKYRTSKSGNVFVGLKKEANTPVGQRDKMKIIDRKPHPDGGHIVTMQTKAGKTIKRHLKNGKVKDMTEATDDDYHKTLGPTKNSDEGIAALKKKHGMSHTKAVATMKRLMGEAIDMSKVGTKATIMHPVTRVSKKVDKKDVKKHVDAGWMHMGPKRNRVTKGPFKTKEGYASDAQRKAVWASKNEKGKKESVDEVLDTPGAMDRYHNKAKAQSDRARNSATAKIVRGNKDISKEKDIIRKREKGMDMATNVRAKQFRKAVTGKPYGEATIPDGQTAMTKVAKVSDSDREKLLKLRKMLDKEKNR